MRKPAFDIKNFANRRKTLGQQMVPGSALVLFAHPEYIRNNDVHYPYRQDSNLFYLTGFEEPETILVFRPGRSPETVLFVRPKDLVRETWDGFRYGPEAAKREFGVDQAFLLAEFDSKINDLLKGSTQIYHRPGVDADLDHKMIGILNSLRLSQGRTGKGNLPLFDAAELIGEMRVKKSEIEMKALRRACEISGQGHRLAMQMTKPGLNERQLHGILVGYFMAQGAAREGYGSIVAGGANATTLHYVFNDQPLKDGDLLLIDAGAELDYYTGDITRTYPVSGKFSEPQKLIYSKLLGLQKQLITMVKPGMTLKALQDFTVDYLTDMMIDLKCIRTTRSQAIETLAFKKYYPHGVGHMLGMDVHDAGILMVNDQPRALEPGMVFTVEPGIYIPADDADAPEQFRGIGIRIEDNVMVTEKAAEVLTSGAPKEIADLESLIGTGGSISL